MVFHHNSKYAFAETHETALNHITEWLEYFEFCLPEEEGGWLDVSPHRHIGVSTGAVTTGISKHSEDQNTICLSRL